MGIVPPITLERLSTLTIGSHINAGAQPRLEAGAQRTLEGVGCTVDTY